jgi:hypothetical protein
VLAWPCTIACWEQRVSCRAMGQMFGGPIPRRATHCTSTQPYMVHALPPLSGGQKLGTITAIQLYWRRRKTYQTQKMTFLSTSEKIVLLCMTAQRDHPRSSHHPPDDIKHFSSCVQATLKRVTKLHKRWSKMSSRLTETESMLQTTNHIMSTQISLYIWKLLELYSIFVN